MDRFAKKFLRGDGRFLCRAINESVAAASEMIVCIFRPGPAHEHSGRAFGGEKAVRRKFWRSQRALR